MWTLFGALSVIIGFTLREYRKRVIVFLAFRSLLTNKLSPPTSAENIFIVFWLQASIVGPYPVLLLCGLYFVVVFFAASLGFAVSTGDWSVFRVSDDEWERRLFVSPFRPSGFRLSHAQVLAASGFCNSLNGILIVYASPAKRTPPLIQAVLQNCGVLFSVPFSKVVLGDTKRYAAGEPLRAAAVVVASVAAALSPTIYDIAMGNGSSDDTSFGSETIAWVAIYIAGLAPCALTNVLQQLYFLRTGMLKENTSVHATRRGTLRALFFANLMQPITYALLWWVDVLPWFGSTADAGDFYQNTLTAMACSVGLSPDSDGCPAATAWWAFGFMAAYILAYVGSASLNKESATFNMLCLVVVTTATAVIWEIPSVNPRPNGTPAWSVAVSLILSLAGSALWKRWEARTPASEQFAVMREGVNDGLAWLQEHGGRTTFDGDSVYGAASIVSSNDNDALLGYNDVDSENWDARLSFNTPGKGGFNMPGKGDLQNGQYRR